MASGATTDPVKQIEQQQALLQAALQMAFHYEAQGRTAATPSRAQSWSSLAKSARRQAAGHKAAMTRIARQAGWI